MRINSLTHLGAILVAVVLVVIGCAGEEERSPINIAPVVWQDQPVNIPADGVSQVEMIVTVVTEEQKRVQNVPVIFRALDKSDTTKTLGALSQYTVVTDENGEAVTYLTSIESEVDTTCWVFAVADVSDTTGWIVNPKTGAGMSVDRAPPGSIAIVSAGPLSDEELEARLHAILLNRAYERAQERRKGLGALLGEPQGGRGAGSRAVEADRLTVVFEGIQIRLSTNKAGGLPADGVSTAMITATARTTRGLNVEDVQLSFTAREGKITSTAQTDQYGIAEVILTSAVTSSAADTITVIMGVAITETLVQTYVQPVLTVSADDDNLPADGSSTTDIRARLLTPAGNPIVGAEVNFSLSGINDASLTVQGATNSDGEAIATLKAGQTAGTATIVVSFSSLQVSTTVDLLGLNVTLTPAVSSILANGVSTTEITLVAKTQVTNVAVVGQPVTFATDMGTIPATATTNSSGVAAVDLRSATTAGTATITAQIGNVTVQTQVQFTAALNSILLTTDTPTLLRDGVQSADVTATLLDVMGDPIENKRVDFALLSSNCTLNKSLANTNSSGEATVTVTADVGSTNDSAQIRAIVGAVDDTITIPLYGVVLSIRIDPDSLVADGEDYVTVEVTVKEAGSSTALIERLVTFAFSPGTFATITPAAMNTNNSGIATATLTASTSTSQTGWVKGRLGADPSTTLVDSVSVSIVAPVRNISLTSADDGILRNNQASTTLTALVTDNTGYPVAGQSVAWSLIGATPAGASLSVSSSETDVNGEATVVLTGDAAATDATATVQAAVGSSTATFGVTLQGVAITVTAVPTAIIANGVDAAVIEATLRETVAGRGVSEETLIFSTSLGTIGGSAVTDDNGKATVTLIAGTTAGTATVKVYSGPIATGIVDSTTVSLAIPTATSISLSASPTELRVKGTGGVETASVTATVLDKDNQPVPAGEVVAFALSPAGSGTFGGTATVDTTETNANGQAVVQFQSGTVASDITITADVVGTSVQSSSTLLTVDAGPATQILLSYDPTEKNVEVGGFFSTTIGALVSDVYGNSVTDGTQVYFQITVNPDRGSIVPMATTTDGLTSTKLTYPDSESGNTLTVQATTLGGTITATIVVTLP